MNVLWIRNCNAHNDKPLMSH